MNSEQFFATEFDTTHVNFLETKVNEINNSFVSTVFQRHWSKQREQVIQFNKILQENLATEEKKRYKRLVNFENIIEAPNNNNNNSDVLLPVALMCESVDSDHTSDIQHSFVSSKDSERAPVLRPHQVEGIRFLWQNLMNPAPEFEFDPELDAQENDLNSILASSPLIPKRNFEKSSNRQREGHSVAPQPFGCILSHFMGLGKTCQVTVFLYLMLTKRWDSCVQQVYSRVFSADGTDRRVEKTPIYPGFASKGVSLTFRLPKILIVVPKSTVAVWLRELEFWSGFVVKEYNQNHPDHPLPCVPVHVISESMCQAKRLQIMTQWANNAIQVPNAARSSYYGTDNDVFFNSKQNVIGTCVSAVNSDPAVSIVVSQGGGILLIHYEALSSIQEYEARLLASKRESLQEEGLCTNLFSTANPSPSSSDTDSPLALKRTGEKSLFKDYAPVSLLVCDEAHRLKNDRLLSYRALIRTRSSRRLLLSGTPLQNHLMEYWHMISFVMPGFFSRNWFQRFFMKPIDRSLKPDAKPQEIAFARRRTYTLIQEVSPFIQRVNSEPLRSELPSLYEFVVFLRMTPAQQALYEQLKLRLLELKNMKKYNLLQAHHYGNKICAHPWLLRSLLNKCKSNKLTDLLAVDSNSAVESAIPQSPTNGTGIKVEAVHEIDDEENDSEDVFDEENEKEWFDPYGMQLFRNSFSLPSACLPQPTDFSTKSISETFEWDNLLNVPVDLSTKFYFTLEVVRHAIERPLLFRSDVSTKENLPERTLIFSHSTKQLDLLQIALRAMSVREFVPSQNAFTSEVEKHIVHRKVRCVRIDGSVSSRERDALVEEFQQPDKSFYDSKIPEKALPDVFLISTRAGGVGLTLTAATRVIILDTGYNPADEKQAIGRAYRYGQTQPVFVYRLVCVGTLEHSLMYQKLAKDWVFKTVVETEHVKRDRLIAHGNQPFARTATCFTEGMRNSMQGQNKQNSKQIVASDSTMNPCSTIDSTAADSGDFALSDRALENIYIDKRTEAGGVLNSSVLRDMTRVTVDQDTLVLLPLSSLTLGDIARSCPGGVERAGGACTDPALDRLSVVFNAVTQESFFENDEKDYYTKEDVKYYEEYQQMRRVSGLGIGHSDGGNDVEGRLSVALKRAQVISSKRREQLRRDNKIISEYISNIIQSSSRRLLTNKVQSPDKIKDLEPLSFFQNTSSIQVSGRDQSPDKIVAAPSREFPESGMGQSSHNENHVSRTRLNQKSQRRYSDSDSLVDIEAIEESDADDAVEIFIVE